MGLQKSRQQPADVKTKVNAEERAYRDELVSEYRAKLAGKSLDTENLEELMGIVADRVSLSHNLFSLGKEREANTLRKGAIDVLKSKADAKDAKAFEALALVESGNDVLIPAQDKLNELNARKDEMIRADTEKQQEHDAALANAQGQAPTEAAGAVAQNPADAAGGAAQKTVGEINAEFTTGSAQRKQEFLEFMNNEYTPALQDLKRIQTEQGGRINEVQDLVAQSFNLRLGAINIMMELGHVYEAFELSTDTIRAYYDKGIFFLAEKLLSSSLDLTSRMIKMKVLGGASREDLHEFRETGIEFALEGAQIMEDAIAAGRLSKDALYLSVSFRRLAAVFSVEDGNAEDIDNILVSKSQEYDEKGFKQEAKSLITLAADLFYKKLANGALQHGDTVTANKFIDRAAQIKLAIAEDMENQLLLSKDAQQDEKKALMQMFGQAQSQDPSIFDAVNLRVDVIDMYLSTGRFQEIHDMIRSVAEKYKANGEGDARLTLLEMGAEIASAQGGELTQLKRGDVRDAEWRPGQYL